MLKMNKNIDFNEVHDDALSRFMKEKLSQEISLQNNTEKELVFLIPNKLQTKFKDFFDDFDMKIDQFGIRNYSI